MLYFPKGNQIKKHRSTNIKMVQRMLLNSLKKQFLSLDDNSWLLIKPFTLTSS